MKTLLIFSLVLTLASCQRLDSFLFNNDNTITEYKLDAFEGETDFILDVTYDIPDSLIHVFTLNSKSNKEAEYTTIHAIYIGSLTKIKTDTVILYNHGNKWHMDFYWQRAKLLANVGAKNRYGVMMIDYRGFGLSKGKPSEEGMYADIEAALSWLKSKELTGDRLITYGFSLGSAPTCKLAAHPISLSPTKIILEAPFASAEVMVQDASKTAMSKSFFVDLEINNAEEIKLVKQPLLWIHGINDAFLSIKTHGEVVYNNHNGKFKNAHRIVGADHGDVPELIGFKEYKKLIFDFIQN